MAITSAISSGPYTGNGAQTAFPFSFSALSSTDVVVSVDGVIVSTGYTVSITAGGNSGTVTFSVAPVVDALVLLEQAPDFTQDSQFLNEAAWSLDSVNAINRRDTMRTNWLRRIVDMVLPVGGRVAAARAGKFLAWDSSGNPFFADGTDADYVLRDDLTDTTGATLVGSDDGASGTFWTTIAGFVSRLMSSAGSSVIGFIQSGTGSATRTVQAKLRDTMSTADKGTDLKTALDSIATDYAAGGTANIPVGTHSLASTFTFTGDRLNTVGAGKLATIIQFDPASADVAFEINKPGAGGSFQGSLKGIGFYSTNSVDKTAIRLYNQANYEIADIAISDGGWAGDSIGIQTLGRQSLHLHNSEIVCARPVVHSVNPEHATIAVDHFLLEHLELIGTSATRPVVEIEDGVVLSNYTMRNVAIVQGKDGVLWEDTTSTGASYAALFENIRTEQGLDSAAYSFRLGSTAQTFQSVTFRNIYLEPGRNGIRLRNAQSITLDSVVFTMTTGTALDVTFISGTVLVMRNCRFQAGSTITLTNAKRAFTAQLGEANPSQRGAYEVWVYEDPADLQDPKVGAVKFDGIITSSDYTLADGATIELATNEFTGNVFIDSNVGTGATIYLAGGNNVVSERDDPYGQYSVTVGSVGYTNVYWNAVTSRYRLQNLTGTSRTYTITKIGRGV